MKEAIGRIENAELVGTSPNADIALRKIEYYKPDIVLTDVRMPGMTGPELLEKIKKDYPDTNVVLVSGFSRETADETLGTLTKGALDFIPKPSSLDYGDQVESLALEIQRVVNLIEVRRIGTIINRESSVSNKHRTQLKRNDNEKFNIPHFFNVILIGVSTGGPESLEKVIPYLPKGLRTPVLVVQHMPPVFTESLARNLDRISKIDVKESENGEPVLPGTVYIAKGGTHMSVRKDHSGTIRIYEDNSLPVQSCKPSVDVLFKSAAPIWGGRAISVVMTGMGADGLEGVLALKRAGCYSITQSAKTCIVYGMPKAVDDAGLSDQIVDLDRIASHILYKLGIG
jgi:two-component system chemotaxis response regulator CheB